MLNVKHALVTRAGVVTVVQLHVELVRFVRFSSMSSTCSETQGLKERGRWAGGQGGREAKCLDIKDLHIPTTYRFLVFEKKKKTLLDIP